MTDAPTFIRRKPKVDVVETGIISLLANLRAQADRDVFEVLASATNSYMTAMIRFGGRNSFKARDIDHLLTIWQIMLDAGKDQADFAPPLAAEPE